jgi:hypothetical protein
METAKIKMDIKQVRRMIFDRDDNKCYCCGDTVGLCLDHILPKPQFKIHKISNLLTLCWRCNFKKSTRRLSDEEYLIRKQYLAKVNTAFTEEQIIEMDAILNSYFESKLPRHRKQPRYMLHTYKSGPLWRLM